MVLGMTYKNAHKLLGVGKTQCAQNANAADYLGDMLTVVTPARSLCSADAPILNAPSRVRTEIGRRAFSVAASTVLYNSLSADIRLCASINSLKFQGTLKKFFLGRLSLYAAERLYGLNGA